MRWVEIVILHEYDYVNQVNKRAYNGSMGAMSMYESPSTPLTFSPLISCQTHLNNMWQAKRMSELRYDDILKSMGSVMKYLAKVTFKLSATNQTIFFESLDPKVYKREAREEAAKIAYEYLLGKLFGACIMQ